MKILLVNDYSIMVGGAEKYLIDLNNLLKYNNHITRIIGSKQKNSYLSFLSRVFSLNWYFKTKKIIKEFKPDILHINSCSWVISPSPIIVAKKFNIPVVCTVHNFHYVCPNTWMMKSEKNICKSNFSFYCTYANCYPRKLKIKKFLNYFKVLIHRKILKKYVDIFICPSKILTNYMKKTLKINNVVYNPNFVKNYSIKDNALNDNYFLYVGRLSKEKGVDILIKAFSKLNENNYNIKLKIVGSGIEKENLIDLCSKLNLNNSIDFLGFVNEKKLKELYQGSKAIIMPSFWMENNPIVGLETLSFGKPLIGSNIGGIPELIIDNKTGYLFNPGNDGDLFNKMKNLLDDNKNIEMGNNAKKFYFKNFTPEIHIKKIMDIYNSVIK